MIASEDHYTYQHLVHVNALGLRGPELPEVHDSREVRVLALGDSMTYGQGVADEATLPAYLQQFLNEATQESWRVVNGGHRAYGTNQELGLLRELGPRIAPDIVVLFWYHNDLSEYHIDKVYQELLRAGPRSLDMGADASGWALLRWRARQVLRRSALLMYMHDRMGFGSEAPLTQEIVQRGMEKLALYLEQFKSLCEELGAQPVFVVVPHVSSILGSSTESLQTVRAERVKALALEHDLPVIDLEASLRALSADLGAAPIIPYDGHYRGAANRCMARTLAPELLKLRHSRPPRSGEPGR